MISHVTADDLLDVGAYKSFLRERRRLVAERLNGFLAVPKLQEKPRVDCDQEKEDCP